MKSSGSDPMLFPLPHGADSGDLGRDSKHSSSLLDLIIPGAPRSPLQGSTHWHQPSPGGLEPTAALTRGSVEPGLWAFEPAGLLTLVATP